MTGYDLIIKQEMEKQEIERQGIEPQHFETFCRKLSETKQLPPANIVPPAQYQTILVYLKQKQVLSENNGVRERTLKLFEIERGCGQIAESVERLLREFPDLRHCVDERHRIPICQTTIGSFL